ncbi:MAG: polysaccharide deacetylase family protein [Firmicutes bacterium]|nr:polysaccharide deacetylase family protein [Bacillota bacterium]
MKNYKIAIAALAVVIMGIALFTTVYYTMQLSLSLNGPEEMTIGLNGLYEEKGAKACVGGRDASDRVQITGSVDTSTPGTYTLKYEIETLTVERKVTVTDKMKPELILEGDDTMELMLGEDFEEPGYRAADENGRDITGDVKVTGTELTRAGENQIKYTVSDSRGNTTQLIRSVNVLPNTEYDAAGLPVCMYHYVYDENDPPEDLYNRFGNYISQQELEKELNWLNEEGYYFPTWKEVREYIDGELMLPDKSIVITFDDGSRSFLDYGIPVLEKCCVPATSFVITSNDGEKKIAGYQSDYVTYQSHSDNMHRPGGNIGHGGIFTALSYDEALADLQKSIEICGTSDAFAYPYGDYNDSCRQVVEDAGFLCAVTTQAGKAYPGDDPMLLPRVRMSLGQSIDQFISMVQPPDVR